MKGRELTYLLIVTLVSLVCSSITNSNSWPPCYSYDTTVSASDSTSQLVFTSAGLNTYLEAFVDDLGQGIMTYVFDDIGGITDLLGISIMYNLTDIYFSEFSIESFGTTLATPYLDLYITNVSAQINFKLEYVEMSWPYVGDSVYGTATLTDLSFVLTTDFVLDPVCNVLNAGLLPITMSIGDIDITLHGGASWLYDLILDLLEDLILDVLVDKLALLLYEPAQAGLTNMFSGTSPVSTVGQDGAVGLDMRWTSSVSIGQDTLTLAITGIFERPDQLGELLPPPEHASLPPISSDAAIQVFYGLPYFTTLLGTLLDVGKLSGTVTAQDAGDYGILLSTDVLSAFVPGLADYPGQSLTLSLEAVTAGVVTQPVALFMNVSGVLGLHLDGEGSSLLDFSVSYGLAAAPAAGLVAKGDSNQSYLYLDAQLYNLTAEVAMSAVGPVDVSADLLQLIGLVGSEAVAPRVTDLTTDYTLEMTADYIGLDQFQVIIHDQYVISQVTIPSQPV